MFARCSPAGRARYRFDAFERSHDRGPATVRDPAPLRREDQVVRATVGGIRDLADVAARDEPANVVTHRRRRQARLGGQRSGRDGLEARHPADEREELVGDIRLRELLVHEQRDEEPGRVELLEEVGVMPSEYLGHARIIRWT